MIARHTTIFEVHNVLAAFIAIFLTTAAANAATYTYDLTLRFNGDYVLKLVSTPSKYEDADWTQESCYRGSSCYPTDFRPNFPDSLFRHLDIGATTSASFARDQHRTTCQIAGVEMNCSLIGMSMSVLEFYSSSPDYSIFVNFDDAALSYVGEAGSYYPFAQPGCTPFFGNFCEYWGYGAEFTILADPAVVPIPATFTLLGLGILGLAVVGNSRRRRL